MPSGLQIPTDGSPNTLFADKALDDPTFSLGALLSPIGVEEFFADVWEQRPLVINRDALDVYGDLLSLDDVDHALTTLNLRYPEVRLASSEQPPKADDYTFSDGRIDVLAVSKLFANGVTIVLDQMQRHISALGTLCRDMESEIGATFQTNLYLTPPHGGGFKVHYDTHDVFILQIAGSKEWGLFESPIALPMSGQYHEESGAAPGQETHRFTLRAGDIAYIPRGIYHQAHASDELSLHITLGAMVRTWCELMLEAVSELSLRDVAFRRALPIGFGTGKFNQAQAEKEFRKLAQRMVESMDFKETANGFRREFARVHEYVLRDQLLQMAVLKSLSAESVVVARSGGTRFIERLKGKIIISHLNRTIEFPAHAEKSLEAALSGAQMRVADIDGDLDLTGKLALARRLIEEGLLRTIPD
jgi:ribosomal protein L16 Arg81 hydroxylase